MSSKILKKIRCLFLAIGAVLLVVLIKKIGLASIANNIADLGWYFIPILNISFASYLLYTVAWRQFLRRLGEGIGFLELFRIKIMGEAVNTLTPANFLGGDPMRIYLLKKNFRLSEGAASVVVDRTLHTVATLIIIIVGIAVAFQPFEVLPMNIKVGVPVVLFISSVFIGFVLIHQRRGIFGLLLNVCRTLHIKKEFSEKTIHRFNELDSHIIEFYEENHRGFLIALSCHVVGRLLGVVEIYAIGRVVSDDFTILAAFMLTALAPMINAVFAFIPGAIGVMEGAYSGMLYLIHLDPVVGITIQIAKRLRSAFWIALGLMFLGAHGRKQVWEQEKLIEEV